MIGAALLLLGLAADPPPSPCAADPRGPEAPACAAAIESASDPKAKAALLFQRAYALNELEKYQQSLADLDRAVALDPANARAAHERGYTLNALGRYSEGLKQLDRDVALNPGSSGPYKERAFSRHHLADFAGEYADRDTVVKLSPGDGSALLGRSDAALWLGRFDAAEADVDAAEHSGAGEQAARQRQRIALWRTGSGAADPAAACTAAAKAADFDRPHMIGDCTAAFLAASKPADKAEMLTYRSTAWLVADRNQAAATEDNEMAAAIDPDQPNWHSNLGFSYLTSRHSWAASQEFDRALAKGESWFALAGRANARHNLGDREGAFRDAKRSFELKPNEIALTTLGDLAHERGDDKSARLYWMDAYRLGDRSSDLLDRLRSIGVDHPEQEERK